MTLLLQPNVFRAARVVVASIVAGLTLFFLPVEAATAATRYGAGTTLDQLQVGKTNYQRVQVRSVNARTIMISHAGGLASVRLGDLSPELQQAFGYNPEAAAAADAALKQANDDSRQIRANPATPKPAAASSAPGTAFDRMLQNFGQPPEIRPRVDLRPKFIELSLGVKNQGARPSCAVFAIVSALEFQSAQLKGEPERFSEEYLIWATRKTLRRPAPLRPVSSTGPDPSDPENYDYIDEGFALSEVVTALRAYGIPLQSSLPYTFGQALAATEPPSAVVDEAKAHRRVSVIALPGRDQSDQIANLIQALNAGVPVAVGMWWPSSPTMRSGLLNNQRPTGNTGHAVTIVGYENKTGRIENTVFIFKNSWGARWGTGGYGYATYAYIANNLIETALLEIEPAVAKPARG